MIIPCLPSGDNLVRPDKYRWIISPLPHNLSLQLSLVQYSLHLTYRKAGEGHLDVGVDQVSGLAPEGVLQVGHDGGVHPREAVCSVDPENDEM